MRAFHPRSFRTLILVGFGMALLPLLATLISSVFSVNHLVERSTQAIYRSVAATESGRIIHQEIVQIERISRQYQVLKDAALLNDIENNHLTLIQSLERLKPLAEPERLQMLIDLESAAETLINQFKASGESVDLHLFADLNSRARSIYFDSYDLIVRQVEQLQGHADKLQQIFMWTALSLFFVTAALVLFFTRLLVKPIRQIHMGIARIGSGDYDSRISVSGPQDLVLLGDRLDWLRQRLDGVEREKARFLAHVSHELKTPLASIREGSELLMAEVPGPLTEQQLDIAHILQKNSLRLQKLIVNLLSYSRRQVRDSEPDKIDILELIEDILEDQRPAIVSKQLKLQTNLSSFSIKSNYERLHAIVDNLLSNAIKYTPAGGQVELTVIRSQGRLLIEVADSGPGIDPTEKEKIFDPFFQGQAPCLAHVQGTGIGLSIVRDYIVELKGEIQLDRSMTGGALFKVTLPLHPEKDLA